MVFLKFLRKTNDSVFLLLIRARILISYSIDRIILGIDINVMKTSGRFEVSELIVMKRARSRQSRSKLEVLTHTPGGFMNWQLKRCRPLPDMFFAFTGIDKQVCTPPASGVCLVQCLWKVGSNKWVPVVIQKVHHTSRSRYTGWVFPQNPKILRSIPVSLVQSLGGTTTIRGEEWNNCKGHCLFLKCHGTYKMDAVGSMGECREFEI